MSYIAVCVNHLLLEQLRPHGQVVRQHVSQQSPLLAQSLAYSAI